MGAMYRIYRSVRQTSRDRGGLVKVEGVVEPSKRLARYFVARLRSEARVVAIKWMRYPWRKGRE